MRAKLFPVAFVLVIAGCASSPNIESFNVATSDFTTAKDDDLCAVYGFRWNRSEEARAELRRRGTFTESEWKLIEAQKVIPGMTECGVKAAYPLQVVKSYSHEDVNGNLIGRDMVFSCKDAPVPHCPYTKVEIRGGKVTALIPASHP